MTGTNTGSAVDFVANLELAEVPAEIAALDLGAQALTVEDDEKAAYVDAGSLVSFVAGMNSTNKSDVLNSTLLAQLAANKQFNREEQTVEWYQFYRNVLENVGWVLSAFNFTKFSASGSTFSVDEVVAKLLASIATGADMAVIYETIEAVKALPEHDGRRVLFDKSGVAGNKGNFQISVSNESDGVAVMKIGAFYFDSQDTVTQLLWFKFYSTRTSFYQGAQTINLNSEVYANVRQAVKDKLGDKAVTFVAEIEI